MVQDAILAGVGAGLGFAALHIANDNMTDLSCLCPPLGAVAVLLFCMPSAPASQPKAVIGGHLIAGFVAYSVVQAELPYREAASVALTIFGMAASKLVHPPAGAYAFLFASKKMGPLGIVAPGLAGACILLAIQYLFLQIKGGLKTKAGWTTLRTAQPSLLLMKKPG